MKLDHMYDHRNASSEWGKRDLRDWLADVFEAPSIRVEEGCTANVREHVKTEFERAGWATNVKIDQDLRLSVFAIKDDLAFHLQTGNVSRAAYDLLKLQQLYGTRKIQAAALAVPTKEAAQKIGSNIANASRIANELELFDRIVTVPILVIAFE